MREEKINRIEVHVAAICFKDNGVFCLKRSPGRKIYPNLWECGGGAVWPGENFEEAARREMRDEAGIIIEPLFVFGSYEILASDTEQKKIPGIRIICEFKGYIENNGEPKLSDEHIEWKWQPVDELEGLNFIHGVKEEIKKGYRIYKKKTNHDHDS